MVQIAGERRHGLYVAGTRLQARNLHAIRPFRMGDDHPNRYRPVRFFVATNDQRVPGFFLSRSLNPLTHKDGEPRGGERSSGMARLAARLENGTHRVAPVAQRRLAALSRPSATFRGHVRIFRFQETVKKLFQSIVMAIIVRHSLAWTELSAGRDAFVCIHCIRCAQIYVLSSEFAAVHHDALCRSPKRIGN